MKKVHFKVTLDVFVNADDGLNDKDLKEGLVDSEFDINLPEDCGMDLIDISWEHIKIDDVR